MTASVDPVYFASPLPAWLERQFPLYAFGAVRELLQQIYRNFRHPQKLGPIATIPILGGLHHQYVRI
jgi:hypothetical protein